MSEIVSETSVSQSQSVEETGRGMIIRYTSQHLVESVGSFNVVLNRKTNKQTNKRISHCYIDRYSYGAVPVLDLPSRGAAAAASVSSREPPVA